MSYRDQMRALAKTLESREKEVFTAMVDLAHESIQTGSPVTGAPGQPVGQDYVHRGVKHVGGTLRASWQKWFDSPVSAKIATNIVYAPSIEEGIGRYGEMHVRSTVGGFHSVKMTIAGWQRIADHVVEKLQAGA